MKTDTAINGVRKAAAQWAERLLKGDLSNAEHAAFQHWLMTNEVHQREFRAHSFILNLACDLPQHTRDELLAMAMESPHAGAGRRKLWLSALAASARLTLGLAGWFVYRDETAPIALATSAQMTRDVTLPDGSIAHLNTLTDLHWVGRSGERRVALRQGEALFEVRHDPSKPFIVGLDASEIRVLGTRFNVRRRQNAEVIVTVLEGTVRVASVGSSTQPTWTRTLQANEQIVYGTTGLVRDIHPAAGANAALWRQGILEFEDEPLANVVEDLGRYSNRQILVRDPRLAQLRLGGQLNVHDNIEASLGLLEKLAPVNAHRSGDTFVLDYRQEPTKERH